MSNQETIDKGKGKKADIIDINAYASMQIFFFICDIIVSIYFVKMTVHLYLTYSNSWLTYFVYPSAGVRGCILYFVKVVLHQNSYTETQPTQS